MYSTRTDSYVVLDMQFFFILTSCWHQFALIHVSHTWWHHSSNVVLAMPGDKHPPRNACSVLGLMN